MTGGLARNLAHFLLYQKMCLNFIVMKLITLLLSFSLLCCNCSAQHDKIITYEQLPANVQSFIKQHYPASSVQFASLDDDLIRPDYDVALDNMVKLEFYNSGTLKIISDPSGIPQSVLPAEIFNYVFHNYPKTSIVKFEVERNHFEVELSNKLDLKFNKDFRLLKVDHD